MLKSISPISKMFETGGSTPVLVLCDDIEEYVCKFGARHNLFNEYFAAEIGKIFSLPIPDYQIVKILDEHLHSGLLKRDFIYPCFGSKYLQYAKEVDSFFITWSGNNYELKKILNKEDLLMIGLFDLWLCNEDRNHNNSNLLLVPKDDGYKLYAIDHVMIFNTNAATLERGLVPLTYEESILGTEYLKILFKDNKKLKECVNSIIDKFYFCVENCFKAIPDILKKTPKEWEIDIKEKESLIKMLFDENWIKACVTEFKTHISLNISKL